MSFGRAASHSQRLESGPFLRAEVVRDPARSYPIGDLENAEMWHGPSATCLTIAHSAAAASSPQRPARDWVWIPVMLSCALLLGRLPSFLQRFHLVPKRIRQEEANARGRPRFRHWLKFRILWTHSHEIATSSRASAPGNRGCPRGCAERALLLPRALVVGQGVAA